MEEMEYSLEAYKVIEAPEAVYYIPNFIDEEEEDFLTRRVLDAPKPKWDYLSKRRLQNWGGIIGKKGVLIPDEIPEWLEMYVNKVAAVPGVFTASNQPNHVLVNEYLPGQGIMPHTDGPAFFPTVTTITLGSHCLLDFYTPLEAHSDPKGDKAEDPPVDWNSRYIGSLILEPRSLVVIREDMYCNKLHGIAERKKDNLDQQVFNLNNSNKSAGDELWRDTRISLTIRNVPKVSKLSVMSLLSK